MREGLHAFGDVERQTEPVRDVQHRPQRDERIVADPRRADEDDGEHDRRDRGEQAPEREGGLVDVQRIQERSAETEVGTPGRITTSCAPGTASRADPASRW